jgi:general secretion pathway protein M
MNMINKLKHQGLHVWEGLNARDRLMLVVGGLFLVVYAGYMMYAALSHAVLNKTQVLSEKQATLVWMRLAEQENKLLKQGTPGPVRLDAAKGLTVFSEALSQTSFQGFTYQLQQLKEGELQLSFDTVPYNDFLKWLSSMNKRYAFVIQSFDVEKSDVRGLVKLSMVVVLDIKNSGNTVTPSLD